MMSKSAGAVEDDEGVAVGGVGNGDGRSTSTIMMTMTTMMMN
jgi:hypothetical protein